MGLLSLFRNPKKEHEKFVHSVKVFIESAKATGEASVDVDSYSTKDLELHRKLFELSTEALEKVVNAFGRLRVSDEDYETDLSYIQGCADIFRESILVMEGTQISVQSRIAHEGVDAARLKADVYMGEQRTWGRDEEFEERLRNKQVESEAINILLAGLKSEEAKFGSIIEKATRLLEMIDTLN